MYANGRIKPLIRVLRPLIGAYGGKPIEVIQRIMSDNGSDTMENINIRGHIVIGVKADNKGEMTGKITLQHPVNDKAKAVYALEHRCFTAALQLLGSSCVVTYDPDRRLIVSVRE